MLTHELRGVQDRSSYSVEDPSLDPVIEFLFQSFA